MAKEYDAIRVEEDTKTRLNNVIPDDMIRDDFVNHLLDLYEDGAAQSDENPEVSNEDLRSEISALSDKIDSINGRSRQY